MWSDIWIAWIACVFVSFGGLELWSALISYRDTLSDTVWKWFSVVPGQGVEHWTLPHVLAVIVLLAIAIVLIFHLGFGLFR